MPHVRIRRRCWLARLAGSLGCTSPSGLPKTCSVASAVVLNAGDTLRMAFSVPPSTTADVLSYEVDYLPYLLSSGWQLSPNLYVGDRLVGSGVCNGKWQSTAAAFPLAAAPTFDFSTIAGGSTAGIDFVVSGGAFAFDWKGTISLGRTVTTNIGPSIAPVAAGTVSPLQLVSTSCR